jgi:ribosomal-protein-serine acetyltransferase
VFPLPVDSDTTLELVQPEMLDELQRVIERNLDHLRPWMPWANDNASPSDLEAFVHLSRGRQAEGKGFFAAIRHRGALAGTVGLRVEPRDRVGVIGYWLDRGVEGQGLATRSVVAVLDLCFGELGLHRVEIRCAPGNRRSRAIPERLGFALEGTLRGAERFADDDYRDLVVYAKLATDPR